MISGSVQPYEFASIRAKVSAKSPTPEATRPGMSSRCSAEVSRDSWMTSRPTISPRMPMGTFTKKIQLQSMCSVMSPPMSGPIASAIAETPAQMPIAIPRWCGGKVAEMIESVAGIISAAPTPWSVRAPISIPPLDGEPAGERREREDHEPDQEDAAAPEEVGELAAREHEHGEGERVGVHGPLELGETDPEVALDRRERDVHDRVVEHDHEERERERSQGPPLAVLVGEDAGLHEGSSSAFVVAGARPWTTIANELLREAVGRRGGDPGERSCEGVVAAGADQDRGDDLGLDARVDAPELLLGSDVVGRRLEDGDEARLPLAHPLLEAGEDAAVAHEGEEDRLVVPDQAHELLDPGDEVRLDGVLAGARRQLEQLGEGRLALDDDGDDEVDLVLEVDVDRALGTPGRAGDLARGRAGEPLLADERVGRLDDAAAQGRLGLDVHHTE